MENGNDRFKAVLPELLFALDVHLAPTLAETCKLVNNYRTRALLYPLHAIYVSRPINIQSCNIINFTEWYEKLH